MGSSYRVYKNNVLNDSVFALLEPGETIFYLCVKSNAKVKTGCCDPWSENGNHQTVGKNKWFPQGAYWYFTAVRVVVKPVQDAMVNVRFWDTQNNTIFHEGYVNAGKIYNETSEISTVVHITDWDGYKYTGWNVQLPDGTVQYSGTERDAEVTLVSWVPQKYLNIEYLPYMNTGVEVRYWDKVENKIIFSENLSGGTVAGDELTEVLAKIMTPDGYKTDGWNVQLTNGTIQYEGNEPEVLIGLNGYIPKKYLNVKCYPVNNKKLTVNYINSVNNELIKTTVLRPDTKEDEDVTINVELETIEGYVKEGWKLKNTDGEIEKEGTEEPVGVMLTKEIPHKILDVNCFPIDEGEKPEETPPPPEIEVKPSGICDGIIEWTETDSHRVFVGYTVSGRRKYETCRHTFEYKAVLGATHEIAPDTLKSGYGFGVDVSCTLDVSLVKNNGCRSWGNRREPVAEIVNPTKATVYLPWTVTNRLGVQGESISMEKKEALKFTLPESPISEIGARKIYTPVELPGTKESPEEHLFEIYIGGGGVGDVEFCQKLTGRITINGDMYEDDVRPDRALL